MIELFAGVQSEKSKVCLSVQILMDCTVKFKRTETLWNNGTFL